MKTKWTLPVLGVLGVLGAIAAGSARARGADLQPMAVTDLSGQLRIQQGVPCADDVDQTTPVTGGRIEIAPADGVNVAGGKSFTMSRMGVFFAPFSVHRDCLGVGDTRNYTEVGAQLGGSVVFTGATTAPGVFGVTIPKENFLIYQATIVNGSSDASFKRPKEDVTGSIDLNLGTVQLHAVIATKLHFEGGCTILGCLINEDKDGTLTADISGTIVFPDSDGDGVPDRTDNCRFTPNADQTPVSTPVITAPPAVTLASCADHHFGFAAATDVCEGRAVTVTNDAPGTFAIGANPVTWSGNDGLHPVATASQNVTIVDTTPPIITSMPPDVHLNDCKGTALGLPTAIDDCAGTVTFTNNAPPKFFAGATAVTWTAHDVSGNVSTSIQTVTVTDAVPPTVTCVPAGPPGGTFQVSASDACDTPIIRLGSFVLADGERIKINETGQSGVTLINVVNGIRHFHVGKGQAVITATDAAGNVASAACH